MRNAFKLLALAGLAALLLLPLPMSPSQGAEDPASPPATAAPSTSPAAPPLAANRNAPPPAGPAADAQPASAGSTTSGKTDEKAQPADDARLVKREAKPDKAARYQRSGICKRLDDVAAQYDLPPLFFARLIWQESRFNPDAVSPAGAEGIAQFMPGTAAIWGLDDPYDPQEALLKSAQYLDHLHRKLGNLGLAAAGYNAGSQRVVDWLAGSSFMPTETRNYVYSITGYTVEEWADGQAEFVEPKIDRKRLASACAQLEQALKQERRNGIVNVSLPDDGKPGRGRAAGRVTRTPPPPWGVQLAGSFSRAQAMKQFNNVKKRYGGLIGASRIVMLSSPQEGRGRRTFHRVRVGTDSRAEAESLCNRLQAAGGACVVMKN